MCYAACTPTYCLGKRQHAVSECFHLSPVDFDRQRGHDHRGRQSGPFFNFRASAELLVKDVAPDFAKLTLDGNLVHNWIDGDETRLLL